MHGHSRRAHRWRRFEHKYRGAVFVGLVVLLILGLVAGLMYVLTSPDFRMSP